MCGRFTLYHDDLDLSRLLGVDGLVPAPRYNVAPTSEVAWVRQRADGTREMLRGRWGLVPHWVGDPERFRATLFNARSETAGEKPSFRDALRRARCVVPVSGFYEWRRQGERKQPFHVVRADGAPLLLAGLYAERRGLNSVAVLTCAPNALMATLHDRMPVVLDPADLERWLDPTLTQPEAVADLMSACPDEWLSAYPVDPRVGNARIDESALVQAVTV